MSEIQDVPVRLPVKLGQFLKLSGLVDSGSEASDLIASGDVDVDGELETRRGRQLHGGEIVTVTTDAWEARGRVVDASA
ncbi:RNA-binding S4 domain-containing protein [Propioniciclava tarda]|uniref:RNA-binding S4 domain-containing protein n=1 Tax=Propioniciclava tarda TaxID=433330 RepID=A0A4Q9KJE6_PROTD|nr:RNA-binding S4 domain-containing protein [Propioniciclava tarda]TBT94424.1 RNA-binding S4 domain-containing protein [Propioniciclava tarda]SMO70827.1 ribosome-associated protein [Propioniciclava tarda]HOA88418.1 RNA-binding S4 domain-containing protein [Propioniciclava tarda]HQA30871.1 RNA-binding S4 domain-containing protein [Propioniciclava tarda]HQD60995.1 RNA-binding S4 domain-containing protein [Propioniciclava tarda]